MPLDFTSCYYQSSLLSFTSIAQIFQSGQSQHCLTDVCFSTYDTFFVDPCPICVCVCTNRCLCTTSFLYVQRSAQNYTTTQSKQIFHQASVTFLDLPIQNGDSSALVLTSSHPIGHSEIHLVSLTRRILTDQTVDPLVTTALTRLRRLKHRPAMRAEPTKCWFVSKRKQARRA